MAGTSISVLRQSLHHDHIIRAMPNMPAQIGQGMTIWTATTEISQEGRDIVQEILKSIGKEIYVDDEKYIDMATALSGSGPAYCFLFFEALVDAGVHIGLPRGVSYELALKTLIGSANTIEQTGKHPAELTNMVTSPGGTTADALLTLEKGAFRSLLVEAVVAAYKKAQKL
jgi:pyrroline-5-carboxylate reductase